MFLELVSAFSLVNNVSLTSILWVLWKALLGGHFPLQGQIDHCSFMAKKSFSYPEFPSPNLCDLSSRN